MSLQTRSIRFSAGTSTLHGHLAWDDDLTGARPGVLICPDASGLGAEAERRAAMLADLGYVALAMDYYGDGLSPSGAALMQAVTPLREDLALLRSRAQAGLDALRACPEVDPGRVAAIGYCFGGSMVLELARSGADLLGVVCFHGALTPGHAEEIARMRAAVLVLTGADDPMVPPEAVRQFTEAMRHSPADWQVVSYGGTVHAFTRPDVAERAAGNPALAYHERSDQRSWIAMRLFFNELFGA
jgi:dienelactone hydrolase